MSGVASRSPMGPQSHVQNAAEMNDRDGGKPGRLAEEQGLDDVTHQRLNDDEERRRPKQHRPTRIDGDGQRERKQRRKERADIGHEPHHAGENAPEDGARNADEPQAQRNDHGEGGVQAELHEIQAAQPMGRIVDGGGGALDVVRPREPDHAIPEILALEQNEHDEDDDQARRRQRVDDGRDEIDQRLHRPGLGRMCLDGNGPDRLGPWLAWRRGRLWGSAGGGGSRGGRRSGCVRCWPRRRAALALEFLAKVLKHVGGALDGAMPGGRTAYHLRFLADGRLIAGQVSGKFRDLNGDDAADRGDHGECDQHHDRDGEATRQAKRLKLANRRREHEAEQDGERDRNEDLAPGIQGCHDSDRDDQRVRRRAGSFELQRTIGGDDLVGAVF